MLTLHDIENLLFVYKNTFSPELSNLQIRLILLSFQSHQRNTSTHRFSIKYVLEQLTAQLGFLDDSRRLSKKVRGCLKKRKFFETKTGGGDNTERLLRSAEK